MFPSGIQPLGLLNVEEVNPLDALLAQGYSLLALDLSYSSTGVSWVLDGELSSGNIYLTEDVTTEDELYEARIRLQLKNDLLEAFQGIHWDCIIIEDVFFGVNPKTYRQLVSLNTAIDELVLEGSLSADQVLRIQNKTWKSWLKPLLPGTRSGYLNDKVFIQEALATLGIYEEGRGYQDRLDSQGMILGWLLQRDEGLEPETKKKVLWSQVSWSFTEKKPSEGTPVSLTRPTKEKLRSFLSERGASSGEKFFLSDPLSLGVFGSEIGAAVFPPPGGYLSFWKK